MDIISYNEAAKANKRLNTEVAKIDLSNVGTLADDVKTQLKGDKGDKGDTGANEVIDSVDDNGDGTFTWNFKYGGSFTTSDLKGVKGDPGNDGADGTDGDSEAMTDVVNNNDGTYTWKFKYGGDFTTGDLKGDPGNDGSDGADGLSVKDADIDADGKLVITLTDDSTVTSTNVVKGDQGPKGDKGNTGDQGPKGDKGDTGPKGDQGPKGDKGADADKEYIRDTIGDALRAAGDMTLNVDDSNDTITYSYTLPANVVKTDVASTFTTPQRTSTSVLANDTTAIDFKVNNNIKVTLTADADITLADNGSDGCVGQSGVLTIEGSEYITGWGADYTWKNVPSDLSGTETFAYFIRSTDDIVIGRVS